MRPRTIAGAAVFVGLSIYLGVRLHRHSQDAPTPVAAAPVRAPSFAPLRPVGEALQAEARTPMRMRDADADAPPPRRVQWNARAESGFVAGMRDLIDSWSDRYSLTDQQRQAVLNALAESAESQRREIELYAILDGRRDASARQGLRDALSGVNAAPDFYNRVTEIAGKAASDELRSYLGVMIGPLLKSRSLDLATVDTLDLKQH